MTRQIDRIIASSLGKPSRNAAEFSAGTKVGPHTLLRRVGSENGCSQWLLVCPNGHEFRRKGHEIRKVLRKKQAVFRCKECVAAIARTLSVDP